MAFLDELTSLLERLSPLKPSTPGGAGLGAALSGLDQGEGPFLPKTLVEEALPQIPQSFGDRPFLSPEAWERLGTYTRLPANLLEASRAARGRLGEAFDPSLPWYERIAKGGLGALETLNIPFTAAAKTYAEEPVTWATGSPIAGQSAGVLANVVGPAALQRLAGALSGANKITPLAARFLLPRAIPALTKPIPTRTKPLPVQPKVLAQGASGPAYTEAFKPEIFHRMKDAWGAAVAANKSLIKDYDVELSVAENLGNAVKAGKLDISQIKNQYGIGLPDLDYIGQYYETIRQSAVRMAEHSHIKRSMGLLPGGGSMIPGASVQQQMKAAVSGMSVDDALEFIARVQKAPLGAKVSDLLTMSALSGLTTQEVNTLGNFTMLVQHSINEFPAALISKGLSKISGKPQELTQAGAASFTRGALESIPEAFAKMKYGWQRGWFEEGLTKYDLSGTGTARYAGPKFGKASKYIYVPGRGMHAMDEFFSALVNGGTLRELATNKLIKGGIAPASKGFDAAVRGLARAPNADMIEEAKRISDVLSYREKLGPIGNAIATISNSNVLGKLLFMFVRTPINIVKTGFKWSPLSPLLKSSRDELAGNLGQAEQARAISRMLFGSLTASMWYRMAREEVLTGTIPKDPGIAAVQYAAGEQPVGIKAGGISTSITRLDPHAIQAGIVADIARIPEISENERVSLLSYIGGSVARNLTDKTYFQGLSNALMAWNFMSASPIERAAGVIVPTILSHAAESLDDEMRVAKTVTQVLQNRLPFLRNKLYPSVDIFGEHIPQTRGGLAFIQPFRFSELSDDPVRVALAQDYLKQAPPKSNVTIPGPRVGKKRTKGRQIELPDDQYYVYASTAGRLAHEELLPLVTGRQPEGALPWEDLTVGERQDAVDKAFRKARRQAREYIFNTYYPSEEIKNEID